MRRDQRWQSDSGIHGQRLSADVRGNAPGAAAFAPDRQVASGAGTTAFGHPIIAPGPADGTIRGDLSLLRFPGQPAQGQRPRRPI